MRNVKVLVHILDEYNDENILTTFKYSPERVIFLREDTEEKQKIFKEVKTYLRKKVENIIVEDRIYDGQHLKSIVNVIDSILPLKPAIHLSKLDNPLVMIMLAQRAWANNLSLLVSNGDNNDIYKILKDGSYIINTNSLHLNIEDLIVSTGGKIISETTSTYDREEYFKTVEWIIENYKTFKTAKNIIRTKKVISVVNEVEPLVVSVSFSGLNPWEKDALISYINYFKKSRFLKITGGVNGKHLELKIKDDEAKAFFYCSGTWLELLTYKTIKEMNIAHDLRMGVKFVWDNSSIDIINELDVVFTRNNKLCCISCKDTSNYEAPELNELEVYSNKIGGDSSGKILIATSVSKKVITDQRAQEMGINLIIFRGNLKRLENEIKNIALSL